MVDSQRQERCLIGQGRNGRKNIEKIYKEREYELSVTNFISAILLIVGTSRKLLRISLTFYKANNFKEPITFS